MLAMPVTDAAGHAYPAGQGPEHAELVNPELAPNRPPGQGAEHADDVSAGVSPYTPGGHSVHVAALPVLYCPAGHGVWLEDPAGQA